MGGLARIDATIHEAICRIAIEKEMPFVEGEPLIERLKGVGVTEAEIMEAQEILEGRGFLEVLRLLY